MITSSFGWIDLVSLIVLPLVLPALVGLVSNSSWSTLWKRLTLGGLSLVTSVLTGVVQAITTGTKYDIGWAVAQFVATWGLAELTYYGILKAPITTGATKQKSIASVIQSKGNK